MRLVVVLGVGSLLACAGVGANPPSTGVPGAPAVEGPAPAPVGPGRVGKAKGRRGPERGGDGPKVTTVQWPGVCGC
jgi:hypothetical protein